MDAKISVPLHFAVTHTASTIHDVLCCTVTYSVSGIIPPKAASILCYATLALADHGSHRG